MLRLNGTRDSKMLNEYNTVAVDLDAVRVDVENILKKFPQVAGAYFIWFQFRSLQARQRYRHWPGVGGHQIWRKGKSPVGSRNQGLFLLFQWTPL